MFAGLWNTSIPWSFRGNICGIWFWWKSKSAFVRCAFITTSYSQDTILNRISHYYNETWRFKFIWILWLVTYLATSWILGYSCAFSLVLLLSNLRIRWYSVSLRLSFCLGWALTLLKWYLLLAPCFRCIFTPHLLPLRHQENVLWVDDTFEYNQAALSLRSPVLSRLREILHVTALVAMFDRTFIVTIACHEFE